MNLLIELSIYLFFYFLVCANDKINDIVDWYNLFIYLFIYLFCWVEALYNL